MRNKYLYFKNLNNDLREMLFEELNDANVFVIGVYIDKHRTAIVYEEISSYGVKTKTLYLVNRS